MKIMNKEQNKNRKVQVQFCTNISDQKKQYFYYGIHCKKFIRY